MRVALLSQELFVIVERTYLEALIGPLLALAVVSSAEEQALGVVPAARSAAVFFVALL